MTFPSFRLQRRPGAPANTILGRSGKETLRFPLPVPGRLAVIDSDFHLGPNMQAFASNDLKALTAYAPDALALPLSAALSLADRKLRGLLELSGLKFAIVVFSSLDPQGEGPLANHHRDLLWKAFGLPVFEQLRGWDHRVIARECEVHDGLHFNSADVMAELDGEELLLAGLRTGLSAEIVTGHCDCGIESERLRYRVLTAAGLRTAAA